MKLLAYKAIATAAFSVFAINSAQASNMELTVNGEVIATTCKVNNKGSDTKAITLVGVPSTSLAQAGQIAGPRKTETFSITGCEGTSVKVSFDNKEDFAGSHLKNIAVAAGGKEPATNVAIKLTDKDLKQIDVSAESIVLPLASGAADFVIGAEYYALGEATAGLVKGQLKMTLAHQ